MVLAHKFQPRFDIYCQDVIGWVQTKWDPTTNESIKTCKARKRLLSSVGPTTHVGPPKLSQDELCGACDKVAYGVMQVCKLVEPCVGPYLTGPTNQARANKKNTLAQFQ